MFVLVLDNSENILCINKEILHIWFKNIISSSSFEDLNLLIKFLVIYFPNEVELLHTCKYMYKIRKQLKVVNDQRKIEK